MAITSPTDFIDVVSTGSPLASAEMGEWKGQRRPWGDCPPAGAGPAASAGRPWSAEDRGRPWPGLLEGEGKPLRFHWNVRYRLRTNATPPECSCKPHMSPTNPNKVHHDPK